MDCDILIVGAGIVSGISGGSRQVSFGHRFYYFARTRHPAEASRRTHGEVVAVGLVLQLAYYGRMDEAEALAARLRGWGLADTVAGLGLPDGPAEVEACLDYLRATKEGKAVGTAGEPRLREALKAIYR